MHSAAAPTDRGNDIASTVVATMGQMGVIGLPRNYEIFYEALTGSNPDLGMEVVALGNRPTQEQLDRIGRKFFAQSHTQGIVEQARDILARELEGVASLLRNERGHIERYGQVLDETTNGLNSRTAMSQELLQRVVGVMSVATASTIDHGKQFATALGDKSAELETVKSKLEEYKKLADTDPLTHIWNRRAFDHRIAQIYDGEKGVLFSALILADIDRFKEINDKFGHPVGDKILQVLAGIFQNSVHRDMFVARTGGEEFALIVEGISEDATVAIADRIRTLVAQTRLKDILPGMDGQMTVSMGVCMASDADGPADLYAKADRALYRSKLIGRNRVTPYSAIAAQQGKSWLLYKKD